MSFQLREQLWNPISNFKEIGYVSPSSATLASPLPQRSRVRSLAEPRSLLIFFVDVKIHSHLKLDLVTWTIMEPELPVPSPSPVPKGDSGM